MKTVLVTGATDGIGQQAAIELARLGYAVVVHGRSPRRVEASVAKVREAVPSANVTGQVADLTDLDSVRTMASRLLGSGQADSLVALLNNASVFEPTRHTDSRGLERTFVVSHLAHFLLTGLLLPALLRQPHARVVNVSSMAHAGSIDFDNLQGERNYSGTTAYARAKLCNLLFTRQLAQRLGPDSSVTVNALHPGVITTKLLYRGWGMSGAPVERGAQAEVDAIHNPAWRRLTGAYFMNQRPTEPAPVVNDPAVRSRLWEVSESLAAITYP